MQTNNGQERPRALDDVVSWTVARVGRKLVLAAPLGLGKPNALLNAFYARARTDPKLELAIITALCLMPPTGSNDVERRFVTPFSRRHFGADYPRLNFVDDQLAGRLPPNVTVSEFYFQSGARLGNAHAQRHYISSNYTHVARDVMDRGLNVIVQLVAEGEVDGRRMLSLSCNPDVTLDLAHRLTLAPDYPLLKIAQVHRDLPFLHGDALVPHDFFDVVVEPPAEHRLFAVPRAPVTTADYCVGLHASALIADHGTLQIGIGGLSDGLVNALVLRQRDNERYRRLLVDAGSERARPVIDRLGGRSTFAGGLFGASEMFLDGFMHLYQAGILKRAVHEDLVLQRLADQGALPERPDAALLERLWEGGSLPGRLDEPALARLTKLGVLHRQVRLAEDRIHAPDGAAVENDLHHGDRRRWLAEHCLAPRLADGALMEGAFFLGSEPFYQWLRDLDARERPRFRMASVRRINQLYGGNEVLEIQQRRNARFVNSCMMMTATGAAVSDGLADHQVVSGVGGQYNFVAMAHALHEGRSLLMLRARRDRGGSARSNIVWDYPHTTIPRHLRDLVVTEYGIAELRGRTDEECIEAMVAITDRAFQDELVTRAKEAGKLRADYRIPDAARENTPERLEALLRPHRADGLFGPFPFGADFDAQERRLIPALQRLKALSGSKYALLRAALRGRPADHPAALERMGLSQPEGLRDRIVARALAASLDDTADAPT